MITKVLDRDWNALQSFVTTGCLRCCSVKIWSLKTLIHLIPLKSTFSFIVNNCYLRERQISTAEKPFASWYNIKVQLQQQC